MLANGACFRILRREDSSASFLWELRPGGDRRLCREIISTAKKADADYWFAFVAAIVEIAGGAT